ncbi:UDP-N-acetylglucosamine 2-epimerase (non-hydrolyzing) [bacterium]|nr:UDP-N-acetylglucosamine 2-epimerase (non-hydrolyzing) [bacterium]
MKKILIVFGTRPEAIKLAPVIHKLLSKPSQFHTKICVTSQHKEMLEQVLHLFQLTPDYDLQIMKKDQSLYDVTASGLRQMENLFNSEKPDMVLVQGDTNTTFTASLASYYQKVQIGHVEAGLRTQDKYNPFPEEMYRRLTDHLADLCFAPTQKAKENLLKEGKEEKRVFVIGNTVIDSLLYIKEKQKDRKIQTLLKSRLKNDYGVEFDRERLILVTLHRRESFGPDIENICEGFKKIAEKYPQLKIIWPVHLNPRVQSPVKNILGDVKNIFLINPLDYHLFVWMMNRAYLILTDSGGIQEEAPSLGKPVLVVRKSTERPEGLEAGTSKLVGVDGERIVLETSYLLDTDKAYQKMAQTANPYGDGTASEKIISALIQDWI